MEQSGAGFHQNNYATDLITDSAQTVIIELNSENDMRVIWVAFY